jgi:catechol 2,3-dioxygenase-like lactoylglutathione lyase family enzyme
MIVTGLDHCTIRADADTVDACVAFYTSMLNLRIGFKTALCKPGFLALCRGSAAYSPAKRSPHLSDRAALQTAETLHRTQPGIAYCA